MIELAEARASVGVVDINELFELMFFDEFFPRLLIDLTLYGKDFETFGCILVVEGCFDVRDLFFAMAARWFPKDEDSEFGFDIGEAIPLACYGWHLEVGGLKTYEGVADAIDILTKFIEEFLVVPRSLTCKIIFIGQFDEGSVHAHYLALVD